MTLYPNTHIHTCIYIHIYIHVYIYTYIHVYIYIHICMYIYIYVYILYIYISIYLYISIYIYTYISICIYICTHVYVYIYINTKPYSLWLAKSRDGVHPVLHHFLHSFLIRMSQHDHNFPAPWNFPRQAADLAQFAGRLLRLHLRRESVVEAQQLRR